MIVDDKLTAIAYRIDDVIAELIKDNDIDPLSMLSIFTARLAVAADYIGCGDDYRKLLGAASEVSPPQDREVH